MFPPMLPEEKCRHADRVSRKNWTPTLEVEQLVFILACLT